MLVNFIEVFVTEVNISRQEPKVSFYHFKYFSVSFNIFCDFVLTSPLTLRERLSAALVPRSTEMPPLHVTGLRVQNRKSGCIGLAERERDHSRGGSMTALQVDPQKRQLPIGECNSPVYVVWGRRGPNSALDNSPIH